MQDNDIYSKHNKELTQRARILRKNMTPQERNLWYKFLNSYSIRILRQKVIGNYIVDFYCSKAKLAIEIDGGQHYAEETMKKDQERTQAINNYGVEIIRFTNKEIDDSMDGVCHIIDTEIKKRVGSCRWINGIWRIMNPTTAPRSPSL